MSETDPQRFFSSTQRQMLYEAADGRCQRCSSALVEGWHADHRIPWADGGRTEVENGQALCDACNLSKGRGMQYTDTFVPRPFQAEVNNQVLERIRANLDRTIVLASPGSGKTLAYQSLATRLIREGLIDYVAVFVPRVALAEQCETSWMVTDTTGHIVSGLCGLFDATKRLGKIRHRVNEAPLTFPHQPGTGFVSTYSALVTNENTFLRWARQHEGRFLLIADEAQFCGAAGDKDDGGTKAGALVERMHEFALHTLLLTGTPYRADNQRLILADYEADPTNPRQVTLVRHAEATYANGIAEVYLRKFEMQLTEARVSRRTMGDPDDRNSGDSLLEYNLSDDGSDLVPVLKDTKTWQPLVDRVVTAVKDKQKFNPAYRGLISCMGQAEARKVQKYLQDRHPDLNVGIAVSADSDAPLALAEFKIKPMDILVTVRMAFIGYDCPQITVVGILTHYRDGGHLMQLVGRGLRVWKDGQKAREQSCVIIAPDDPKMRGFLALLREERDEGLRIIEEREPDEGADPPSPTQLALTYVESAIATTTRAASNEVDMEADEVLLVESIKRAVDSAETVTKLKQAIELAGIMLKIPEAVPAQRLEANPTPVVTEAPKTERQQIADTNARVSDAVKKYLYRCGLTPEAPGYQDAVTKATFTVNTASGFTSAEANTVEKANKRLRAALKL
ncbi:DEAD/DEAH box helicase family protein [Streptacidiphilus sp. P02-A3a]|nr:DEAD/DEAH box helicase family protein [Streptacidiphilus sp. P02-A3a]